MEMEGGRSGLVFNVFFSSFHILIQRLPIIHLHTHALTLKIRGICIKTKPEVRKCSFAQTDLTGRGGT